MQEASMVIIGLVIEVNRLPLSVFGIYSSRYVVSALKLAAVYTLR
jgi:hypothetical protein